MAFVSLAGPCTLNVCTQCNSDTQNACQFECYLEYLKLSYVTVFIGIQLQYCNLKIEYIVQLLLMMSNVRVTSFGLCRV